MKIFNELLFNASILIAFGIFSEILLLKFDLKPSVKNSIQGFVYGLIILILMFFPYSITEGFSISGITMAIIISALFFGPFAGLISSALGIVGCMLMIGNAGFCISCLIIISAYFLLLGFSFLIKKGKILISNYLILYILGFFVQIVTVLLIAVLASSYFSDKNYEKAFIASVVFYPFVTLFIGYLINTLRGVTNEKIEYDTIVCNGKKFDLVFDQAPVEVVLQSSDGKIIKANRNFLKKYQYTFEELFGKNLDLILFEEDKELLTQRRLEIVKSESYCLFVNGIKKDGSMNYIEIAEKIVLLDNGKLGILSFIKDIFSEAKLMNKSNLETNRANALLTVIPDLLFTIDANGIVLEFKGNKNVKLIASPKEFINKPIYEKLPPDVAEKSIKSIRKSLETGELIEFSYPLEIDGEQLFFESRIVAYGENELFVFVRDITRRTKQQIDLEQNNRFIESLLESMPNPIFYMNREGIYLGANKLFRDLFNLNEKEIIGKKIHDIDYSPDEAEIHRQSDLLILEGKEKRQIIERDIVLPNGDIINTIMTKMLYPDGNNNIGGLIASFIDITDRKKMEQELIRAKNKAEESDRLKMAFLNNLSHEIRTPLNAIMGFGELLMFSETKEERQECVEIIQSNGGQLLNIIDDILAVSRMESEQFELDKDVFEVDGLLNELLQTFNRDANLRELELSVDLISNNVPALVYSDRGKIYRILSCFINNAIKYTLEGKINFGCKKLVDEGIRFYVQDTGVGISDEEKPYIFDRFFRSKEAQLYAIRGNGLGLSIAKGLTKMLGGFLGFESKKGEGSIFYIDMEIDKMTPPFSMLEKKAISKSQTMVYKNLKILVVEDEIDNYLFLKAAFKDKIGKIRHARNGKEAISFLEQEPFNCIIMDTRMPVMDGIEATKKIREKDQDILIISVSAFSSDEMQKEVKNAGCNYFLEKPFRFDSLKRIIEKYFD